MGSTSTRFWRSTFAVMLAAGTLAGCSDGKEPDGTASAGEPAVVGDIGCTTPDRSGAVRLLDPVTGADRWRTVTGQVAGDPLYGLAALAVADGAVALYAHAEAAAAYEVVVLDLDDGSVRWQAAVGLQHPADGPTVAGDLVFWHHWDDQAVPQLRASDLADGSVRWTVDDVSAEPVVTDDGDLAVVGTGRFDVGTVIALDPRSGERRWTIELDEHVGALTLADERVLATTYDRSGGADLVGIDRSRGEVLWRIALSADAAAVAQPSPDIDPATDLVVIEGVAVDPTTGSVAWRDALGRQDATDVGALVVLQPLAGGITPVPSAVVDRQSGAAQWSRVGTLSLSGDLLITDGSAPTPDPLVDAETGRAQLGEGGPAGLDPATGVERWRTPVDDVAGPAFVTGSAILVPTSNRSSIGEGERATFELVGLDPVTGTPRWTVGHERQITDVADSPAGVLVVDTDVDPSCI